MLYLHKNRTSRTVSAEVATSCNGKSSARRICHSKMINNNNEEIIIAKKQIKR